MLKWAKGSKNGGSGHGSAARVSLADLRRASARLLRRKDSSKSKHRPVVHVNVEPDLVLTESAPMPPAPAVPPRCSSTSSSTSSSSTSSSGGCGSSISSSSGSSSANQSADSLSVNLPPATTQLEGVIKQATVRRMSTLRHSAALVETSSSTSRSGRTGRCKTKKPPTPAVVVSGNVSDGGSSSLYMQLDKIPVAVQSTSNKRKVLEDISNQAYRHIIHSLQQELAQLSADDNSLDNFAETLDVSREFSDPIGSAA